MEANTVERPLIITIISIVGMLGVVFSAAMLFSEESFLASEDWFMFGILSIIAGATAMIGLWKMEKWGAHLYCIIKIFEFLLASVISGSYVYSPTVFIVPGIVMVVLVFHYSKFKESSFGGRRANIGLGALGFLIVFYLFYKVFLVEYMIYSDADSIKKCEIYLQNNPDGRYSEEIALRLEDKVFLFAKKIAKDRYNCINMKNYLEEYKAGRYRKTAMKIVEECDYNYAVASQNIELLEGFALEYPKSPLKKKAEGYARVFSRNREKKDAELLNKVFEELK